MYFADLITLPKGSIASCSEIEGPTPSSGSVNIVGSNMDCLYSVKL